MTDMRIIDYEDLYSTILGTAAGAEDAEQFDLLPKSTQAMYVAAILDMEVQNGGLCQFFVNCGSAYATRVADSLRTIGLEPMGVIYESFLLDHQIDPADLSSFQIDSVYDYPAQYERYPFDQFDNAYMRLWEELAFTDTMLQYADAHPEAFPKP